MTDEEVATARRLIESAWDTPCAHPAADAVWTGREVVCGRCGEFVGGVEHSQARHPSSQPSVKAPPLWRDAAALVAVGALFSASAMLAVWVTWRAADWAVGWFWQVIA